MSWFVLNPPQGIRVVSFFITARLAIQDDRIAFIENVLEQLATLLNEPMPAFLTESTRDSHLLGMLADAAHACRARGERLVLVVDGLDEDRGVTTGPHAYSIAALLPDPPPADMRIIIAGRANPPIPADVPEHHRLRNADIAHQLIASPYAAVVRNDMECELKRLLLGSEAEQDLLGLLTASRGGLSGTDLAELTDTLAWQVDDELRAVTGRSFGVRPSRWLPAIRPDVYVLGHEELLETAKKYLGKTRLSAYQQRLHAWADQYREQGWPGDTPEYLLQGYYSMLREIGDLERLMACATDRHRHNRMLSITGGDTAALAEISTAQDAILDQPEPDLLAMARLAVHRDSLTERNKNIPARLPAIWATLGRLTRAETLARAISDPDQQADALADLAEAIADVDLARAGALAQSITNRNRQTDTLANLARKAVGIDLDRAEELARSISDIDRRAAALADLAGEVATTDPGRAEALARSITNPVQQASALAGLLRGLAGTNPDRARTLADDVEVLGRSITDPSDQMLGALTEGAQVVAGVDPGRAYTLFDQAARLARTIADPDHRARALARLAEAVAVIDPDRAVALAESITDPDRQASALVTVAEALAAADPDRARCVVGQAEAVASRINDPKHARFRAAGLGIADEVAMFHLYEATEGSDSDGDPAQKRAQLDRSETLLRAISDPENPAHSERGTRPVEAYSRLLDRLEIVLRSITDPGGHEDASTELAGVVAGMAELMAGADIEQASALLDLAESLLRPITDRTDKQAALATLATLVAAAARLAEAAAGTELDRACSLLDHAEALLDQTKALARSVKVPGDTADVLAKHTDTLIQLPLAAARIDPGRAEALLRATTTDVRSQLPALLLMVRVMAGVDPDRARALADHTEGLILATSDKDMDGEELAELTRSRALALVILAEAMVGADPARAEALADRAEAVARTVVDYQRQFSGLIALALEVARVDRGRAHLLFDRSETLIRAWFPQDAVSAYLLAIRELVEAAAADPALIQVLFTEVISLAAPTDDPDRQLHVVLAEAAAAIDLSRARILFDRAEAVARAGPDYERRSFTLGYLAEAVRRVDPGRARALFDEAETMASSITDPDGQARALAGLAERAADTDPKWARVLLDRADTLVCSIADPGKQADLLAELAEKAARADPGRTRSLFNRVETLLDAITDSDDGILKGAVVAHLAEAIAHLNPAHAAVLLDQAERLTRAISSTDQVWASAQACAVANLAKAVAGADPDHAEALARSISAHEWQAQALDYLAKMAARTDRDRAKALAQSITDPDLRAQALAEMEDAELTRQAKAAARIDPDQAEAFAQKITDPDWKALVLADVAREVTPLRARQLIAQALRLGFWAMPLDVLADVEPGTLIAIADDLLQSA